VRTVQTFVLRLLVDPAEPGDVRGSLQLLPEGIVQPFTGEPELLAALRRLITPAAGAASPAPDADRNARV
jgi:hypothetical protein